VCDVDAAIGLHMVVDPGWFDGPLWNRIVHTNLHVISYDDTTHVTNPHRTTVVIPLETEALPSDARVRTDPRI